MLGSVVLCFYAGLCILWGITSTSSRITRGVSGLLLDIIFRAISFLDLLSASSGDKDGEGEGKGHKERPRRVQREVCQD
jgi:hypothetical protein